ncbi:MAG: phosphatidylserine decarboxylase family protein [Planctomycetaceae bacterium]|nr:phosphatidylserine decarboxylase family protein [Planctomycetaceae bacterium]
MPENIRSVQPGGGFVYSIEMAWGYVRRGYLKTLRRGYVRNMAALRTGDASGAPHEILDPRDLKFCRNLCTARWADEDDAFLWREHVPFARWGLAELLLMSAPLVLLCWAFWITPLWWLAFGPAVVLGLVVWFFRDPHRLVPREPGQVVSPADGVVAEIAPLETHDFVGEPAVRIGIFLSIFNVHINRAPVAGRIVRLRYHPGKFLNALNPESAILNENMVVGLQETSAPYRKMVVRQIAGLFARKIVCDLKPGQDVRRGEKFGMIKLGSRTELILPAAGLDVAVKVGQKVKAGSTVMARYAVAPPNVTASEASAS